MKKRIRVWIRFLEDDNENSCSYCIHICMDNKITFRNAGKDYDEKK